MVGLGRVHIPRFKIYIYMLQHWAGEICIECDFNKSTHLNDSCRVDFYSSEKSCLTLEEFSSY